MFDKIIQNHMIYESHFNALNNLLQQNMLLKQVMKIVSQNKVWSIQNMV